MTIFTAVLATYDTLLPRVLIHGVVAHFQVLIQVPVSVEEVLEGELMACCPISAVPAEALVAEQASSAVAIAWE